MTKIPFNSPASLNSSYAGAELINQRKVTIDMLNPVSGESALDVGCGTGFLTIELAHKVTASGQVIGIDKSEEMVIATAERCADLPWVSSQSGDVTALPFDDQQFDIVSCTQVLLYVDAVDTAISEMMRVLKPGGRIAILETDWRGTIHHSNYPEITDRIYASWDAAVASPNLPAKLNKKMHAAGLRDISVTAIPLVNTEWDPAAFSISSMDWMTGSAYKLGAISKQESRLWRDDMAALGADDAYFFCVNRFLFTAGK